MCVTVAMVTVCCVIDPKLVAALFSQLSSPLGCARSFSPSFSLLRSAGQTITLILLLNTHSSSVAMGESWFQREFLTPKRLAFNVLFYGSHLAFFAYGWYSQVCFQLSFL